MNFSKASSINKGSFVWKRNVNTSDTRRRSGTYGKNNKIRLISQSSDYSTLKEYEN